MKTLYVVYDHNDMPFEAYNSLEDAFRGAMGCGDDYGYPVYIDKLGWSDKLNINFVCENNDLYFKDDKGNGYGMDCVDEWGILWYNIINAETKKELQMFENICLRCLLSFNKETLGKQRKLMS